MSHTFYLVCHNLSERSYFKNFVVTLDKLVAHLGGTNTLLQNNCPDNIFFKVLNKYKCMYDVETCRLVRQNTGV